MTEKIITENPCYFRMIPYINGVNITSSYSINHKKLFSLMLGYDRWNNVAENKSKNDESILASSVKNNLEKVLNNYSKIIEACQTFKENTDGWEIIKPYDILKKSADNFFIIGLSIYCPFYNIEKKSCNKKK